MQQGGAPGVGILFRASDDAMSLGDLASAVVERGFDTLVVGEHTHIPVSRRTPYPAGGDLPDIYRRMLDPYVALAFVAAQTALRIGTCVSLVAQHDPIALAKTIATLDHLSHGRLTLGVGFGWNREELENHGHAFGDRRAIVREHVALMRSLWYDEEAAFAGEHTHLAPSWAWPKPAPPGPPVLLGCLPTERNVDEIIGWADGWIPRGDDADWLADQVRTLRARWVDAGRGGRGPIVWAMQTVLDEKVVREQFARFRDIGVDEVLLDVPSTSGDDVRPLLDRCARARDATLGSGLIEY